MSNAIKGRWIPLHERAQALLAAHYDALSISDRDYLYSLFARKIVWGTELQATRITKIEAQFNPDQSPSTAVAS